MTPIRILIVDDSSTTRLMLTRLLTRDPNIEVAATAADGLIALAKLEQSQPDLVLLDLEMPQLNGLETLRALRRQYPVLPVIMFSRLTKRGTAESVEALFLGADDYILKPDSSDALEQCVEQELLPRIRTLVELRARARLAVPTRSTNPDDSQRTLAAKAAISLRTGSAAARVEVVTIAASTGGPAVLATVLAALPSDLKTPVLIVQHISVGFTAALADRLSQRTGLVVKEAAADLPLDAAQVWIAAAGHHLELARNPAGVSLRLHQEPPEHSCRPAADVLFRSAAEVFGPAVLGVVLTGMGVDGLSGSQAIVDAGGRVIVQDEASSVVWGMAGSVARAGLADAMLTPVRVGRMIRQRLSEPGSRESH
ncbi:MAG: chemotaxis-specific protein-glutamate methyltransferase CheB [Planctomycetota bacterium]|nr:chemotaxis-specific protein-glutamate methyltransferase CheB [Planctomycetota bacterium]